MPRRVSVSSFEGAAGATERQGQRGRSHMYREEHLTRPVSEGTMREGVHIGRGKVPGGPNKTRHLSDDFTTNSDEFEMAPAKPRSQAAGVTYGSVCPWRAEQHPEVQERKSRGYASLPERREQRRAKSPGLAPSWPGHQAADGPVPNRFPLDKNGVPNATLSGPRRRFFYEQSDQTKQSDATTDARTAGRKYFEPAVSGGSEFGKGGRSVPYSFPTTSIHGRETGSAARSRSASPDRFRFQAPYSEHTRQHTHSSDRAFQRSVSADVVTRGVRKVEGTYSTGPSAPFDEHAGSPQAAEAGEAKPRPGVVRSYRPATRIFSAQPGQGDSTTHQRIWG